MEENDENHRNDPSPGWFFPVQHEAAGAHLRQAHALLGMEAQQGSGVL